MVTSDLKFEQAWDKFRAEKPPGAKATGDSSTPGTPPVHSDVLGTWAEVTDEFVKD
ncbi:hypothetical protein [Ramlibacter sp.]|uniref:hypothetical protein n=1 Tax=Ramlibacter sp. TaxID=1917967 RepID=UPI00179AAF4C|nr:hypothetical protein [Ramlibacter sp.]MBA2675386.1 hypothetical protein [Ramlibacter sp.]